jgi:phosphopantothenoylcysteine decarboxylase/phosphopantothenate--cysteine ligase
MAAPEIVIGVTGGIAAYKTAEIVSTLRQKGYGLTVVMTAYAQEFVGPLTFRALSGRPVVVDYTLGPEEHGPRHISLAEKAAVMLIAPCTANIIGKIAHGIADDILTTVVLSMTCPIVIAPAMNRNMYLNPAVQANIALLKERGYHMIDPEEGFLACGDAGIGRLADVKKIMEAVEKLAGPPGGGQTPRRSEATGGV